MTRELGEFGLVDWLERKSNLEMYLFLFEF